jgi:hypothetical protein
MRGTFTRIDFFTLPARRPIDITRICSGLNWKYLFLEGSARTDGWAHTSRYGCTGCCRKSGTLLGLQYVTVSRLLLGLGHWLSFTTLCSQSFDSKALMAAGRILRYLLVLDQQQGKLLLRSDRSMPLATIDPLPTSRLLHEASDVLGLGARVGSVTTGDRVDLRKHLKHVSVPTS